VKLDLRRQLGWEGRSSEAIEDHDVSLEETLPSTYGEQPWASRAGADQADQTRAVVMRNPPSSRSLRCPMFNRRLEPGALLDRSWYPRGEVFSIDSRPKEAIEKSLLTNPWSLQTPDGQTVAGGGR
jgi:hypothetical protein